MPSAGVTPDAVCFTMLVDQLVLEGDALERMTLCIGLCRSNTG